MGMPNLGVTKGIKNSVANAAAQTIIAIILTAGFVIVQVLSGMGLFIEGQYILIMGYYGPIEAIVVGFYFAVNIRRNGNSETQLAPEIEALPTQFNDLLQVVHDALQTLGEVRSDIITLNSTQQMLTRLFRELFTDTSKDETPDSEKADALSIEKDEPPNLSSDDPDEVFHDTRRHL